MYTLNKLIQLCKFKIYISGRLQQSFTRRSIALLFCIFSFLIINAQKNTDSAAAERSLTIDSFMSCLLPVPQRISFSSKTFSLDSNWMVENVSDTQNSRAYEGLVKVLKE